MGRVLTVSNMNPYMVKLQYAVRGPLVLHMHEIDKQMRQGKKMPFPKIIKAQLGDAHHMGQKPITFFRQMVGAAVYPELLKSSKIPEDVKDRINDLLVQFGGSMGTYTNSLGLESIRKTVAKYLERRDKHPVDYDDVVLTTGATTGIKTVLQLFTTGPGEKPSGVMTPTPQYPAYSAAIDEYGLYRVPYMLDKDHNWALDTMDLQRALDEAAPKAKVRALVVINPGNPTGQGSSKPFKKVIRANIGDAHAMGQSPITFIRQVVACVTYPELIEKAYFPDDVKKRAKEFLAQCSGGSVGSYTASQGIELVRRHVAEFIEKRDGFPAVWQDICISSGASTAIKNVLQLFCNKIDGKSSGVMIPIPHYPLYSASLAEYGLNEVPYYLDEGKQWGLDVNEMQRALDEGKKNSAVRAMVVINPGNPTGQVLTRQNIEDTIKFCHANGLFLLADEVYQHNVYAADSKFYSFKKVLREMGYPYSTELELASFMTISKGYMGECGLRGGWMELLNVDKAVQAELYKCISTMLCPTVLGQCAVDCVAKPPAPGEPSFELWDRQRQAVLDSLKERAEMVVNVFNSMHGFKCNVVQGAMYAFPNIALPAAAIAEAKAAGKEPDAFYAGALLEETGICIVPGSGFHQKPGTYHFRTTILPQPPLLKEMLEIFKTFHENFTKKYS